MNVKTDSKVIEKERLGRANLVEESMGKHSNAISV